MSILTLVLGILIGAIVISVIIILAVAVSFREFLR